MITGFRNRQFKLGIKCRVYRNLNIGLWSCQAMEGAHKGKVIFHSQYLELSDVRFIVSVAGQARVKAQKVKHVHAFAQGTLTSASRGNEFNPITLLEVTYDPYFAPWFYFRGDRATKVDRAERVYFNKDAKAYV